MSNCQVCNGTGVVSVQLFTSVVHDPCECQSVSHIPLSARQGGDLLGIPTPSMETLRVALGYYTDDSPAMIPLSKVSDSNLQCMVEAYIECALWSSVDDDGDALDKQYDILDILSQDREEMQADCLKFAEENYDLIHEFDSSTSGLSMWKQVGHCFWLTRNGHGSGFWIRHFWSEDTWNKLSDAAKAFGESNLYVGDYGLIHLS